MSQMVRSVGVARGICRLTELPAGARAVHVGMQRDVPCIWFLCDRDRPLTRRWFEVRGSGQRFPDDAVYVGTYQHGGFVGHVIEVPEPSSDT